MNGKPALWFVCLHGSAKSLIAARLAERIAAQNGMPLQAGSAGIEPDPEVPPHVVAGMKGDGIDVSRVKPNPATPALLAGATHVVSFGPEVKGIAPGNARVEVWNDVPNVSDGYVPAREAIERRVAALLKRL